MWKGSAQAVNNSGEVLRLKGSRLAEKAVYTATGCEVAQTWLRDGVDEPIGVQPGWEIFDAEGRERHQAHRRVTYLAALTAVKKRFPMKVCCDMFENGGCTHGTPCVVCGGTQAPWPWIIHHPFASLFCECHLSERSPHWLSFCKKWDCQWFMEPSSVASPPPCGAAVVKPRTAMENSRTVETRWQGGKRP